MTLSLILLAIGIALLGIALRSLRAHRLKERHALLFACLGLPFFVLAAWPDAVGTVGTFLGIEYQTVLLLCVTMFFLLMVFKLLTIVGVQERQIATLAQQLGVMRAEPGRHPLAPPEPLVSERADGGHPHGRRRTDVTTGRARNAGDAGEKSGGERTAGM